MPRAVALVISAGLVALAVALVWDGAGRGCAPGSDARLVAQVLGYATVGLSLVAALLVSPVVNQPRWQRWWLATVALYLLLLFVRLLQFATGCSN